ncbi:MAG TPA: beta-galactosidase [Thermoanaerobaculia bacterium]|nr:beta-galactosidase [Thermoanaerobaculia bacterium]
MFRTGGASQPRARVLSRVAFLLIFLAFAARSQAADVRGIYVYSSDVSQISKGTANNVTASLSVPGVDGIVLVISWSSIEPSMGQYQWTTLDLWTHRAVTLGKKIDLTITAGSDTPSWLFQAAPSGAGAAPLAFTISPHGGATGVCDSETVAAPWDAAFLNRWDLLLAAVAAHLKSDGTYSAVTLLRLTGVNRTTDELRLPAETPQSTGLACVSDAVSTWQQAGFRPSLLLQAWDQITNSFLKSFPDKSFSVAIIPQNAFPAIGEDGSVIKGTPPDQNQPLLSLASHKLPARLIVQFNFLMPGEAASTTVTQAAQTLGTMAAFQTNNYFGSTGQGAACSEPVTNPTPCTDLTFLALLQTGIYPLGQSNPLRAQYIEVFPANANAFPGDIIQAHDELTLVPRRRSARH